jgi:hypothetical protein
MLSETFTFDVANGQDLILEETNVPGHRFKDGHRNAQVQVSGLAGGSFTVSYRYPGGVQWTEHVTEATEVDTVLIAGDRAPIFDALKVTFQNVPQGTNSKVTLSTWVRGI